MGQLLNLSGFPALPASRYSHTDIARSFIIAAITLVIFLVTFLAMAKNSTTVAPQLFYFPILYTTYFYPGRGVLVAGSCAIVYGITGSYFVFPDIHAMQFVIGQAVLFICVALLSMYFFRNRTRDPGTAPAGSETIAMMIDAGENDHVEFKFQSLWSADLGKEEILASDSIEIRKYKKNASKFIIARSIAGFLNTEGGDLFIGVREDRIHTTTEITGIEDEYRKLHDRDRNPDGYRRMVIDSIVKKYMPETVDTASRFIHISFPRIKDRTVCRLHIEPAEKPVFVDVGNDELFFIRVDASTRLITGKTLTNYILSRFAEKKPAS